MKKQLLILFVLVLCLSCIFAEEHTHSWVFSSTGNTISAYCKELNYSSDCDYQGSENSISLKILSNQIKPVVTVLPDNSSEKSVIWQSSDSSILSVIQNTGVVSAKGFGSATIKATALDGSKKETSIQFDVKKLVPVTFNLGVGGTSYTLYKEVGDEVSNFTTPSNTTCIFEGWYKEDTYKNKYNISDIVVVPEGGLTFYAKWIVPQPYLSPIYNSPTDVKLGLKDWETKECSVFSTVSSTTTEWKTGWYVVDGSVTVPSNITCTGDVYLILLEKSYLKVYGSIIVNETNSLTIYSQTTGTNMGELFVDGSYQNGGIGSTNGNKTGVIVINGGIIKSYSLSSGAGIGGGNVDKGTNITINGGTVTASGGKYGAGIGGGNAGVGNKITINGGIVTSTGGDEAAGIGGGSCANGDTIIINDGTVIATGGSQAAGIGGGYMKDGTNIIINGGIITATGKNGGSDIGGGSEGKGSYTHNDGIINLQGPIT